MASGQLDGKYDVAILGGGLAGMTLALQLTKKRPGTRIFVAEKRDGPAPDAAFKVGESTVELAAHYFANIVGMREHLERDQLPKAGLRFFPPAGDNSDIARRVEWGPPALPKIPSYQIDRGRFENALGERCHEQGIDLQGGSFVDDVQLSRGGHTVTIVRGGPGGDRSTVTARWIVDASGRAGILKRKLDLAKSDGHEVDAAWFRLDHGLDIEEWSDDEEWLDRMDARGIRKLSTNHLMGTGYWVWLIPLATGAISIGICVDPRFHPFEQVNTFDGFVEWAKKHEPQLGASLESRKGDVLDFLTAKNFSYGCKRVFSPERWCVTGEAGAFLDPLFSPGSDFISLSNTFITHLIARDLNGGGIQSRWPWQRLFTRIFFSIATKTAEKEGGGKPPFDVTKATRKIAAHSPLEFFNFLYLRTFDAFIHIYRDQYPVFGKPRVMVAKIGSGLLVYWSMVANLFINDKFDHPDFQASLTDDLAQLGSQGTRLQRFFREWAERDPGDWQDAYVSPGRLPFLGDRQKILDTPFSDDELRKGIASGLATHRALAVFFFHLAADGIPGKPGPDERIDPLKISLDPERWKSEGLVSPNGLTLAEAKALAPGVEDLLMGTPVPATTAGG
ncbi:MAG: NAD(P)/FAD-dependent oxidoreductase [Gaiellaceae bacterium]